MQAAAQDELIGAYTQQLGLLHEPMGYARNNTYAKHDEAAEETNSQGLNAGMRVASAPG